MGVWGRELGRFGQDIGDKLGSGHGSRAAYLWVSAVRWTITTAVEILSLRERLWRARLKVRRNVALLVRASYLLRSTRVPSMQAMVVACTSRISLLIPLHGW